jgi:hypothetical protein
VREEVSPKTYERYSDIIGNFLKPELGALPIAKLSATHIQRAYTKWASAGRRDEKREVCRLAQGAIFTDS